MGEERKEAAADGLLEAEDQTGALELEGRRESEGVRCFHSDAFVF